MPFTPPPPQPPPQAASYGLTWADDFSRSSLCEGAANPCEWYNPDLWYAAPAGAIARSPWLDLQWATGQSNNSTSVSSVPPSRLGGRAWTFGYFEIRMAFDPVPGSWPGLWMISPEDGPGNETDNRLYPELDIFEWQSNTPALFLGTIHVWRNSGFLASTGITPQPAVDYTRFHTYGMLWSPTSVSWYLDNQLLGSIDTTQAPYNAVFAGQQPMFLVLSQQAGCHWKPVCDIQSPSLHMRVQWVHVFQQPGL